MPSADDTTGIPETAADLAARWRSACDCRDAPALASLYEDQALLVAPTGEVLQGRPAMRETLSELVAATIPVRYRRSTRRSLETDGLAVFIDSWAQVEPTTPIADAILSSLGLMIARQQPDGSWLIAIDVPHGTV